MAGLNLTKSRMTDEERLELATKLDTELDDFINSLEKKRYTDGWPEDRWEEEMEKHPFFMKKAPQPGDDVHPMFEGLQKLKYDPEENSAEELALNYKEDGNFYMKHKKYRFAIYSFTEALKANCSKPEVNAILYNNRSAAHFFLKNYRSASTDAKKALELKPGYYKAHWRAAQCASRLGKYDLCVELCEGILEQDSTHEEANKLLEMTKKKKLESERNERKEAALTKKRLTQFNCTVEAIEKRGVKLFELRKGGKITEAILRPKFQPIEDHPVHLLNDNILAWPAVFAYPEFMFTDFQQELREDAKMYDCIETMLSDPLHCDKKNDYRLDNVVIYYENGRTDCLCKVKLEKTIQEIIAEPGFFVTCGSLMFYVVPRGSEVETKLINQRDARFFFNSLIT